ncbi:hypothetical protein [Streptomyces sp. NPDC001893]
MLRSVDDLSGCVTASCHYSGTMWWARDLTLPREVAVKQVSLLAP